MRLLRSFLTLSGGEWSVLVRATVLLTLIRVALGRISFTTLQRIVASGTRRDGKPADRAVTDVVVWAVDAVSRRLPGRTTCLARALTVQALLARAGCTSRLCVGVVRGESGAVEGHAWVECDGRILVGGSPAEIEQFTPLAAFDIAVVESVVPAAALRTQPGDP